MSEWTKRPWTVDGDQVLGNLDADLIGELICEPWGETPEEARANAHLIAAAPELYEALDGLLLTVGLTAFRYEGQRAVLEQAADIARAALSRARGDNHD